MPNNVKTLNFRASSCKHSMEMSNKILIHYTSWDLLKRCCKLDEGIENVNG